MSEGIEGWGLNRKPSEMKTSIAYKRSEGKGKAVSTLTNYMQIWIGTQSFEGLKVTKALNVQLDHGNDELG